MDVHVCCDSIQESEKKTKVNQSVLVVVVAGTPMTSDMTKL